MLSLHELSVVPALRLEALAGRAFSDVTVFGVEPAEVAWGDTLSPAVAGALDGLVEAVLEHTAAGWHGHAPLRDHVLASFTEHGHAKARDHATRPESDCALAGDLSA